MFRPALVVGILAATAAAGPRGGKVVRVERAQGRPLGTPRLCTVTGNDSSAYCFGKKPEVGDVMPVVDMHHVLATLRVSAVESAGLCGQQQGPFWTVKTTLERGDLSSGTNDSMMFGLLDIPVDPHNAKLLKDDRVPPQRQGQVETVISVDSNGDNDPEFEFLQMKCDDSGNPTSGGASFCIEVWYSQGHHFELLRTDRFQSSCY